MANRKKNNNDAGSLPGRHAGNIGFEDKLWAAADKLRGNMDAAGIALRSHSTPTSRKLSADPTWNKVLR